MELIPLDVTAIAVALVGLAVAWVQTGRRKRERNLRENAEGMLDQAEAEMGLQRKAFNFTRYTGEWLEMVQMLNNVQEHSRIDRFVLLVAFNGKFQPRWVSDIMQIRNSRYSPTSYRHLAVDDQYAEMLQQIQKSGKTLLATKDMPDCMLKSIYVSEQVQESIVFHVETRENRDKGVVAITICSYATGHPEGFREVDIQEAELMTNRIKGFAALFDTQ